MKATTNKPWRWLEKFPTQAALLAEWEQACGTEFEHARSFLIPTKEQSASYPCTNRFPCGCEHRVVIHDSLNIVACCQCEVGDCPKFRLQPKDLVVYKLDTRKLGDAIRRAFKFELGQRNVFRGALHMQEVAAFGPVNSRVFFHAPFDEPSLLEQLEGLFLAKADPFLLVMPTRSYYTPQIEGVLKARNCGFIPMSMALGFADAGVIQTSSIHEILEQFKTELARGNGLVKIVEKFGKDIDAVAKGNYELRRENDELRRLQNDGYFKFALRVDREDFAAFAVIMALGNRKAAADHLKIPHRSFYDRVDKWSSRGREYQLMWRYVEWRKRSSRHLEVDLNESLQSGDSGGEAENPETLQEVLTEVSQADNRDYPTILRQILEALQEQNPKNWAAVRDEVVEIVRDEVG